jgi:hypothetical protein
MGKWSYNSTILDLGTRWRWVVSFMPQGNTPQYSFNRRLDGPQSQSGPFGVKKNLFPCQESSSSQPAYRLSLHRLSCSCACTLSVPVYSVVRVFLCAYVTMHVFVFLCTLTASFFMCIWICVHRALYMCSCVCVYASPVALLCLYLSVYWSLSLCTCLRVYAYISVWKCRYAYVCVCVCVYIFSMACLHLCLCV